MIESERRSASIAEKRLLTLPLGLCKSKRPERRSFRPGPYFERFAVTVPPKCESKITSLALESKNMSLTGLPAYPLKAVKYRRRGRALYPVTGFPSALGPTAARTKENTALIPRLSVSCTKRSKDHKAGVGRLVHDTDSGAIPSKLLTPNAAKAVGRCSERETVSSLWFRLWHSR